MYENNRDNPTSRFAFLGGVLVGGGILTSHLIKTEMEFTVDGVVLLVPWTMRGFLYESPSSEIIFLGHFGLN